MAILLTNIRLVPIANSRGLGVTFEHYPPHPSFALVGVRLGRRNRIDRLTPIYAELLDDGSIGPDRDGGAPWLAPRPWFDGGRLTHWLQSGSLRVSAGSIVTGLQVRAGSQVTGIRLHQTPWNSVLRPEQASWTAWSAKAAEKGEGDAPKFFAEPRGSAAVIGLAGQRRLSVTGLSMFTAEIQRLIPAGASSSRAVSEARGLG